MVEGNEQFELVWPDDLCILWDRARGESREERCAELIWSQLVRDLTDNLRTGAGTSHFYSNEDDARDMVMNFMVHLLRDMPRPIQITGKGALIFELRKFGTRENNHYGYEVNEVLRETLHKMERGGTVVRSGAGGRYRGNTCFAAAGSFERMADATMVKDIGKVLPMYGAPERNDKTEGRRFLKPQEAEAMLTCIFRELKSGVFISLDQLQQLAVGHIRNLPKTWSIPYDTTGENRERIDGEDEESLRENVCEVFPSGIESTDNAAEAAELAQEGEELEKSSRELKDLEDEVEADARSDGRLVSDEGGEVGGDGDEERAHMAEIVVPEDEYSADGDLWSVVAFRAADEAIGRIWNSIERFSGTRVFCLYSIPKWDPELRSDVVGKRQLNDFEDFGETNRVWDESKRQRLLFVKELKGLGKRIDSDDRDREFVRQKQRLAIRHIFDGLVGRCTENGMNPSL